jgi:hypothetical protein
MAASEVEAMRESDLEKLLASRHGNGADFWATPDGKLCIEQPVSTLTALLVIAELGVPASHEALVGAAGLVLSACGKDGRVHVMPKGTVFPCSQAAATAALCRNGYAQDPRVQSMLAYLLSNRHVDGGWRCNKFFFGHGPETEHSNPGVTLAALDAFRCAGMNEEPLGLDTAVETLLDHWTVRAPTGPCHYGIGTQFMQVEYPTLRYNLFYYTYVLSFYPTARRDPRFLEALAVLEGKLDDQGRLVVERPNRKLAKLSICTRGAPSEAATGRYREIVANMMR